MMTLQKRIFITALIVLLFLSGCGHQQIASDKAIMLGNKAIEIGEAYMNGNIDGTSAQNDLDDILDRLSYAEDYTYEDKLDAQKFADAQIQSYVFFLRHDIFIDSIHTGDADTFRNVKDGIKKLKQIIKEYD
ncbi:MAG: hypothetical protein HDR14_00970 [Lachnospiraceae bacterium]|nr:hypothetical protein [Lachnospiraceae bacterium]